MQEIAEIFELDAKRTQGEWILFTAQNGETMICLRDDEYGYKDYICSGEAENLRFISSAPKMVEIIRQQQEIIKGLSETIESQNQLNQTLIKRLQVAKEALDSCAIFICHSGKDKGKRDFFFDKKLVMKAKQELAIIEQKEK